MGKSADDLTGFKYPAGGGNDIGVYKQPEKVTVDSEVQGVYRADTVNMSVGNVSKGLLAKENQFGTKTMKGYGAATKGRKISGKQG